MIDFTYATYRSLLGHILSCGHVICPFRRIPSSGKYVILRHDIDYSVVKAVELGEIERELDVQATFFLMLSSTYYNLLGAEHLRAARRLVALGHEIGFHYDTDVFEGNEHQRAEQIVAHARFLSEALETPVTSVAQHNPSVTSTRVRLPSFTDAYSEAFCKQIGYISDSRRLFGASDVFRFFEEQDRAQLLIHPLWWNIESKTRWEAFSAIRTAAVARIDEALTAMNQSMEQDERSRREAAAAVRSE